MGGSSIKNAAITRVGFDYQDLIGIELLIDYYQEPDRYLWVQLESEDDEFRSLDDVVAARSDGTFELTQVKFTPKPDEYHLDWKWLLERKPKGTSRLRKWASSLKDLADQGRVKTACVRTNRRPDPEFSKALAGHFIDLSKVEASTRLKIENDLGGTAAAIEFFRAFEFRHSEKMVDRLEADLRARLVPSATTSDGWLLLRYQAKRWASLRGEPAPDGQITHKHLTQIINKRRPQPLFQDFRIPDGYEPPSQTFHEDLMIRVTSDTGIWALWGSPGRGKSTYLSYAVEELRRNGVPTVRHHYFLSLADTGDRNSFADIATSLMDQMVVRYGDAVKGLDESPTTLRSWVIACGNHFAKVGKPFVVVIDGLDHVAREYADLSQMNQLFNTLLPAPANVTVLVGTQRVADKYLPLRLVQHGSQDKWIEVPRMDLNAVQKWIALQNQAGRVLLNGRSGEPESHKLGAIGDAFYDISMGHPLHLIYSFEAMVRRGIAFAPDEIARLPACPDGDIRKYYAGLWRDLSPAAKQVVHAMAGSGFRWTDIGLVRCFGPLVEIDHLLEFQRSGVAPFHGSLLAFVKERDDHERTFQALLPQIVSWLETDAPRFQRWGWLWIIKASNGDGADLLAQPTRQWVIDSLVEGWPPDQVVSILAKAEELAFARSDYVRTTELRALKTRVENSLDYQINGFAEVAIRSASNLESVVFSADQLGLLDDEEILTLVKTVPDRSSDIIEQAFDELRRRVNLWIELRHHSDQDFEHLVQRFLEVAAIYPKTSAVRLVRFLKGFRAEKTRNSSFRALVRHLRRERRSDLLVAVAKALKGKTDGHWRHLVEDALVVVASVTGLNIAATYRSHALASPLLACWRHFHGLQGDRDPTSAPNPSGPIREDYEYGRDVDVENYFVGVFFAALANNLAGHDAEAPPPRGWAGTAVKLLTQLAKDISTGRAQLSFAAPYYAAREVDAVDRAGLTDPAGVQYTSFVHSLREIAICLHAIKSPAGRVLKLSADDLATAKASKHWSEDSWLAEQLESNLPLLEHALAKSALDKAAEVQVSTITVFNERADRWIELAKYALLYDLPAHAVLARAASCIIGYGWRKDPWIYDVLVSVEEVARGTDVTPLLRELVPVVEQITEFTDGKGTNHARTALLESIAHICPERLVQFYAHHIAQDDYHLAEDALREHIKIADFSTLEGRELAGTLVEFSDLAELQARTSKDAATVLRAQLRFVGGMPTDRTHRYTSSSSAETPKKKAPDPTKYRASQFAKLATDFSDYSLETEAQKAAPRTWLKHWVDKGRAKQALASVRAYYDQEKHSSMVDEVLDDAFEVSLAVESRDDAYRWLVRAHIVRRGWESIWTSEKEIKHRLQNVATHFPEKWQDYIRDTSDPAPYWKRLGYSFSIGFRYLVYFLLLVGKKDEAAALATKFVEILKQEVSDQPIPSCPWFV